MNKQLLPPRLKPNSRVGVISPSNTPLPHKRLFLDACDIISKSLELKLELSSHALGDHWYTTGTAKERVDDIHAMFLDPTIDALFMSGGGSTNIDLVPLLDYELIRSHPKIFAGISDAATLLNAIYAKTGLVGFCGFEFKEFGKRSMTYELESLRKTWFVGDAYSVVPNLNWHDFYETPTRYAGWQTIRKGAARGPLVGTNMGSLLRLLGTDYAPDFAGAILGFETYRYPKHKIHETLSTLRLHGVFDKLAGMIIGYCVGSDDTQMYGDDRPLADLVLEVTQGYEFPVMSIGEMGHYVENFIQPIGGMVQLGTESESIIIEPCVV